MYDKRKSLVQRLVFTTVFMVLGFVVAACAAPAAPGGAVPATSGESAAAPGAEPDEVTVWLSSSNDAVLAHVEGQLERFEEEHPDIQTEMTFVQPDSFSQQLLTAVAAGTPPDVVGGLSYYMVASLHRDGALATLEELADSNNFLPDALDSNRFPDASTPDRLLRGIPWLRFACSPRYLNLVQPIGSQNPENAAELINFLTREDQQIENFEVLSSIPAFPAYPNQQTANQALGDSACPERAAQVQRLYTLERDVVLGFVNERIGSLQAKIAGEPTAVLSLGGEERRAIEYQGENPDVIASSIQAAAAPVVLTPDDTQGGFAEIEQWRNEADNFTTQLEQPEGAIVGALFVVDEWEGIPAGDYIVNCSSAGQEANALACTLTDAANNTVDVSAFEVTAQQGDTGSDVGYPFATYETESPGKVCFWIDGKYCCVGR
jgi:hypothetical protein